MFLQPSSWQQLEITTSSLPPDRSLHSGGQGSVTTDVPYRAGTSLSWYFNSSPTPKLHSGGCVCLASVPPLFSSLPPSLSLFFSSEAIINCRTWVPILSLLRFRRVFLVEPLMALTEEPPPESAPFCWSNRRKKWSASSTQGRAGPKGQTLSFWRPRCYTHVKMQRIIYMPVCFSFCSMTTLFRLPEKLGWQNTSL